MFQTELKKSQPLVSRVLKQSLTYHRLAHAYLFVGSDPVVKEKTALLLTQSLVCQFKGENGWACEKSEECLRVKNLSYGDFIFLDGKNSTIKKEAILNLQHSFNQTAIETANQKIYIINYVENSTLEALNSLLKFLEDPISQTVTGILIAMDENLVLPTIVSRCQVINFLPTSYKVFYQENLKLQINNLDAYLLSKLVKDSDLSLEIESQESYQTAKTSAMSFLEEFLKSPQEALLNIQLSLFKSKQKVIHDETIKYFLEILIIFFQDCILKESEEDSWWDMMLIKYQRLDVSKYLAIILKQKRKVNPSINLPLLIDQLVYQMQEVKYDGK